MFWELLRLRFSACIQYIHTCKLASSCSYRHAVADQKVRRTGYGALASGPRSSTTKNQQKSAYVFQVSLLLMLLKLKFASEQHKKQADLKDIGAFLLIFSHPAFFFLRAYAARTRTSMHILSHITTVQSTTI